MRQHVYGHIHYGRKHRRQGKQLPYHFVLVPQQLKPVKLKNHRRLPPVVPYRQPKPAQVFRKKQRRLLQQHQRLLIHHDGQLRRVLPKIKKVQHPFPMQRLQHVPQKPDVPKQGCSLVHKQIEKVATAPPCFNARLKPLQKYALYVQPPLYLNTVPPRKHYQLRRTLFASPNGFVLPDDTKIPF